MEVKLKKQPQKYLASVDANTRKKLYSALDELSRLEGDIVPLAGLVQRESNPKPPDSGNFWVLAPFSSCWASAQLHLKKRKSLKNFSLQVRSSFAGADYFSGKEVADGNIR